MRYKRWLAALVWLAVGAGAARASDLESLHIINANLDLKPGWTLQLHSRFRTFKEASAFQQFRIGPILLWQAKPRLTLLGGQYFLTQEPRSGGPSYRVNRSWGGTQVRLISRPSFWLDGRTLAERHISAAFHDYWRMRARAMITFKARGVQPFTGAEVLRQQNAWYGRYTAGVQWRIVPKALVSLSYEYRDAVTGPGSHVIATMIQFDGIRFVPAHVD